jgi:uncharacterized protein
LTGEETIQASAAGEKMNPGDLYKVSRFLHLFDKKDRYCLMHSLTQKKVFGGAVLQSLYEIFTMPRRCDDVVKLLSSTYPENILYRVIDDLRNKGLIVSGDDTDLGNYLIFFHDALHQYNIQHLYLLPTNDCNLRCRYCFIEDGARPCSLVHMTEDIARKSLEIFAKLTENADKISLTFYGGEPLLNADIVYFSMRYARTLEKQGVFKRPVEIVLITNGTLVDDKTIEAVAETNTIVSISIDGPGTLNEARKDVNGRDSLQRALEGFRKFQDAGISPGISCTLNQSNADHIEEIIRFFADTLKIQGMSFNILIPQSDGTNPLAIPDEHAACQIIRAFMMLREKGIYEDRIMRRIIPFITSGFAYKDCMGVGGQVVITPDGKIGPCQAFLGFDEYFPLSVESLHLQLETLTSEDVYKTPLFDEWRHRFPLNMKQCIDCSAIAVCGGGCPYAAFASKGSMWEIDERVCSQSRKIMEWMLWDTYDRYVKAKSDPGFGPVPDT